MFRVAKSETFWSEARVEMTTEDGRPLEGRWRCQFKRLADSENKALLERYKRGENDSDVVRDVLVGWDGLCLEVKGNEPTPFSAEALEDALEAGLGSAMMVAYVNGRPKAKAKN